MTARIEWTTEHVMNALAEIKLDVGDIAKAINGNGAPGIKGRLMRLEAGAAVVLVLATMLVTIGSCAVGNGYLVVPTTKAATK